MNQEEHLKRIRARCVELLALFEKRTPGRWYNDVEESWKVWDMTGHMIANLSPKQNYSYGMTSACQNALFISSCAGPAEAGWKATIAAIDGMEEMEPTSHLLKYIAEPMIAAWPEELL